MQLPCRCRESSRDLRVRVGFMALVTTSDEVRRNYVDDVVR
jgi:hypothetical protein